MLKKITLLLFVALTAVMFGCKKDEIEKKEDSIVGYWTVVSSAQIIYTDGVETRRNKQEGENVEQIAFEFLENGAGRAYLYDDDAEDMQWVMAEDFVTVKADGDTFLFNIKTLNDSDLVLALEESYSDDGKTYKEVWELRFKKR